ncbi:hypothetical protein B4129_2322 [Bacillus safensis]|nr:hypothetical protein B4129_2322 [Bacillus safensis]
MFVIKSHMKDSDQHSSLKSILADGGICFEKISWKEKILP